MGTTSATIATGTTGTSFNITAINDLIFEGSENVIVSLGTITGATAGTTNSQTINIIDDETIPEIILTASPSSMSEFA